MTTPKQFRIPDEVELLEFFGADPVERSVENGYWCYELVDERGVTLKFSFNIFEQSVQAQLSLQGKPIAIVSHETAERMVLREGKLQCDFCSTDTKGTLTIEIGPSLQVVWSTLRVR